MVMVMRTEPAASAWQVAADHGCDMLLLESNLEKTPQQRVNAHRKTLAMVESLESEGYALRPSAIDLQTIEKLKQAIDEVLSKVATSSRRASIYGARNLLTDSLAVSALAHSNELRSIVTPALAQTAFPVRCLFFDKTPEANWPVAWHQDLTIAVQKRIDVKGFGPWTVKAGVPHVQPPKRILQKMLTVRIHLDDCGEDNGPLLVSPGSHKAGILTTDQIQRRITRTASAKCLVPAGGALVMKPLLLHSSARSLHPSHRRVIHLEYAAMSLPGGLEWYHFTPAT
jgi:ectoine hydroxylase-related dioxygenase (phytanoyl-CoA dioxygenase family)